MLADFRAGHAAAGQAAADHRQQPRPAYQIPKLPWFPAATVSSFLSALGLAALGLAALGLLRVLTFAFHGATSVSRGSK
ncbi:hypothetical protein LBMAG53_02620 [Planctomycetota bacterium]|nr:hypothetical protein LBMAG53_02620 [Planctomycetota bacterium]